MKVKTSVTLSEALLKAISAESNIENRSDFIESAVWMYLERLRLRERDRLEIERINTNAAFLNAEGGEAGEFQNEWPAGQSLENMVHVPVFASYGIPLPESPAPT